MREPQRDNGAKKCPLLPQYLEGCYCTNLISQNTEAAILYCGGNYRECDVYKRIARDYSSDSWKGEFHEETYPDRR
ncbi:MAG: hypothetical protein R3231_07665 [bacterium]|nr:hypothetical protein [bacterium]